MLLGLAVVGFAAFFIAMVAALPRLLLRPLVRSSLWSLRDEIFDARRNGSLPWDQAAPKVLILQIEGFIGVLDEMTFGRFLVALPGIRRMSAEERAESRAFFTADLSEFDGPARDCYRSFERRFQLQALLTPFVSSWLGIVMVAMILLLSPVVVLIGAIAAFSRRTQINLRKFSHEGLAFTEDAVFEFHFASEGPARRVGKAEPEERRHRSLV
jgi:hypothetical protein